MAQLNLASAKNWFDFKKASYAKHHVLAIARESEVLEALASSYEHIDVLNEVRSYVSALVRFDRSLRGVYGGAVRRTPEQVFETGCRVGVSLYASALSLLDVLHHHGLDLNSVLDDTFFGQLINSSIDPQLEQDVFNCCVAQVVHPHVRKLEHVIEKYRKDSVFKSLSLSVFKIWGRSCVDITSAVEISGVTLCADITFKAVGPKIPSESIFIESKLLSNSLRHVWLSLKEHSKRFSKVFDALHTGVLSEAKAHQEREARKSDKQNQLIAELMPVVSFYKKNREFFNKADVIKQLEALIPNR